MYFSIYFFVYQLVPYFPIFRQISDECAFSPLHLRSIFLAFQCQTFTPWKVFPVMFWVCFAKVCSIVRRPSLEAKASLFSTKSRKLCRVDEFCFAKSSKWRKVGDVSRNERERSVTGRGFYRLQEAYVLMQMSPTAIKEMLQSHAIRCAYV